MSVARRCPEINCICWRWQKPSGCRRDLSVLPRSRFSQGECVRHVRLLLSWTAKIVKDYLYCTFARVQALADRKWNWSTCVIYSVWRGAQLFCCWQIDLIRSRDRAPLFEESAMAMLFASCQPDRYGAQASQVMRFSIPTQLLSYYQENIWISSWVMGSLVEVKIPFSR